MNARIPAEVFPPGEFLKEELEARNWSQVEFADIIGKDTRLIYELINGKRMITPETAVILGEALGTSPDLWMNLESQYQLSKVRNVPGSVSKKADLHTRFPVRELTKRNWIGSSTNIDVIERQLLTFFEIKTTSDQPQFSHAAKKADQQKTSISQLAWLFRVREIAKTIVVKSFDLAKLKNSLPELAALRVAPEEARQVSRILNGCGVRLVFVEPLPGSKIDGACFWLEGIPVIAMSLRFDRIDNFWFVLRHEIEHVIRGHGKKEFFFDQDMDDASSNRSDEEIQADKAAANFCVNEIDMQDFLDRVAPYFYEQKVIMFAQRVGVHPGIVVGQIQRRLDRHDLLKRHQVKIRSSVISSAASDGWGHQFPLE